MVAPVALSFRSEPEKAEAEHVSEADIIRQAVAEHLTRTACLDRRRRRRRRRERGLCSVAAGAGDTMRVAQGTSRGK